MKPYYDDGKGIVIYHGDCRDVLPTLGSVDLVLTSPPYNLGVSTGGGMRRIGDHDPMWAGAALRNGYGVHDDAMDPQAYVKWQKSILTLCWSRLTENGAIYYQHKPRVQAGSLQTPLDLNPGLPVRQIVIWNRRSGFNFAPTHYVPAHEWVVIFAKPAFRLKGRGGGISDVWEISPDMANDHPAPFPVGLARRVLDTTTGETVLDPFMGSGTTRRAAKDLGRKAIGIEIEERYCEIAAKRLQQEVLLTA